MNLSANQSYFPETTQKDMCLRSAETCNSAGESVKQATDCVGMREVVVQLSASSGRIREAQGKETLEHQFLLGQCLGLKWRPAQKETRLCTLEQKNCSSICQSGVNKKVAWSGIARFPVGTTKKTTDPGWTKSANKAPGKTENILERKNFKTLLDKLRKTEERQATQKNSCQSTELQQSCGIRSLVRKTTERRKSLQNECLKS